jgi:hypothetical protein
LEHSLIWTGFLASLGAGAMTGVGALPVFFPFRISARIQDVLLGFAAGVMLAAAGFSLIAPGSRPRRLITATTCRPRSSWAAASCSAPWRCGGSTGTCRTSTSSSGARAP